VLEPFEAVPATLDLLHQEVEAFGRSVRCAGVVVSEDLLTPSSQRVTERTDLVDLVFGAASDGLVQQHFRVGAVLGEVDYQAAAGSKFEKYARRLGVDVRPHDAKAPSYVMPPYLVAGTPPDPWWEVSNRLYEATSRALKDDGRCVRVIAAQNVGALAPLTLAVSENRAAIWVSGLEELTRP
jgi:hypothetical protein